MVADGGLAEAERLGQVADAGFAPRLRLDQAEQPKTRRVGDHLQRRAELLGVLRGERLLQQRRAGGGDRRDRLHVEHIDRDR